MGYFFKMTPHLRGTNSTPPLGLLGLGSLHATAKGCPGLSLRRAALLGLLLVLRIFDLKGRAVVLTYLI